MKPRQQVPKTHQIRQLHGTDEHQRQALNQSNHAHMFRKCQVPAPYNHNNASSPTCRRNFPTETMVPHQPTPYLPKYTQAQGEDDPNHHNKTELHYQQP